MASDTWHDFYLMTGSAAAALTGLVFVAVSLHLSAILEDPRHRRRAGSSLLALASVVFVAGAILVPSQPRWALALEIASIFAVNAAYNVTTFRDLPQRKRRDAVPGTLLGFPGIVLGMVGGIGLVVGGGGGFVLLLPGVAAAVGFGIWNSWALMVSVALQDRDSSFLESATPRHVDAVGVAH